jgi:hypothetical protein
MSGSVRVVPGRTEMGLREKLFWTTWWQTHIEFHLFWNQHGKKKISNFVMVHENKFRIYFNKNILNLIKFKSSTRTQLFK